MLNSSQFNGLPLWRDHFAGKASMTNIIKFWVILTGVFLGLAALGNTVWAEQNSIKDMCDKGNSTACFKVGQNALSLDRDNKTALVFFTKACDGGHMTGCTFGGNLMQNTGKQYSPQWKKAAKMFQKACDAGEDASCFNLGSLKYKEGRASKAKKYYQQACDMGNQPGCANVEWLSK